MGNTQSAENPRNKPSLNKNGSESRLRKNRLSKPRVGGETYQPIATPIAALTRRQSNQTIQNVSLPNPPSRLNSIDVDSVPIPHPPRRSGSMDMSRRGSLTHWHNPSVNASHETLNITSPASYGASNVGAGVWLERQRSQLNDPRVSNPVTPIKSMSPSPIFPPMPTKPAEHDLLPLPQALDFDLDELAPPMTSSSASSYHSAPQSPTKRFSPSPTKFMSNNGSPYQAVSYPAELPAYPVPVRRRSLLQAAAPGTATRPKAPAPPIEEPTVNGFMDRPPSQLLALDLAGVRPKTPQELELLGSLRKGTLFITNGAPSPAPSSPDLRAASFGSQRQRDSSLLSIPPLPVIVTPDVPIVSTSQEPTPTKKSEMEKPIIRRKPVPSASPTSAEKPPIHLDTALVKPVGGLRLVPPSPDKKNVDDFATTRSELDFDGLDDDQESIDEDPHRQHLFTQKNKQFMNGEYEPTPSVYSQSTSADLSAKPGLHRSPFSFEGAKLLHAANDYSNEVEDDDTQRWSIALEPSKGWPVMDTPTLEMMKPAPLAVRRSPDQRRSPNMEPVGARDTEYQRAISATEEKLFASPNGDLTTRDPKENTHLSVSTDENEKKGGTDSGYSSAASCIQPPPPPTKSWRRSLKRQSAPAPATYELSAEPSPPAVEEKDEVIRTSVVTIPYSSVRNRTPPMLVAPPKPHKTSKEAALMAAALGKKVKEEDKPEVVERPELKEKKRRRLSFKRRSFKTEKQEEEPELPVQSKQEAPEFDDTAADRQSLRVVNSVSTLDLNKLVQSEKVQKRQEQPSLDIPDTNNYYTSNYGYGSDYYQEPEPVSPVDASPYEPIAITSFNSISSPVGQALRSSETVSYTGAAYYQRFSTPSPGPGGISALAAQNQSANPSTTPSRTGSLSRANSISRHTTPPSSFRLPSRYSMDDVQPDIPVRMRPANFSPVSRPQQSPQYNSFAALGTQSIARNTSSNSLSSYYARTEQFHPSHPAQSSQSGRNSRDRSPYNALDGPHLRRRMSNASSGSVGPSGYPHMGQDFTSDRALFGLDFGEVPVLRANSLVNGYGTSGMADPTKPEQKKQMTAFELFHQPPDEEELERFGRKKDAFWRRARSKSRPRA